MATWLSEVQRDPRTMGAFRRRIETLLSDPAVARRIKRRLDGRDPGATAEPEAPANGLHCAGGPRQSLFGRCDCPTGCCMMAGEVQGRIPSLAAMPAIGPGGGLGRH